MRDVLMRRGVLGFRGLLQLRATRFWVALVCLWVALAPAWHICDLSGHVRGMASHGAMHHDGAALSEVTSAENSPPRPLICYCAARPHSKTSVPRMVVSATPDAHRMGVTCLAQLLQTMPGHFAALPARSVLFSSIVAAQWRAPQSCACLAPRLQLRGRSPPLTV